MEADSSRFDVPGGVWCEGAVRMRMVPAEAIGTNSPAERRIFGLLREADLGDGAFALHSLNLPRHSYKRWSEADFVVVCRLGLLLVEVKGGGVRCQGGIWEFTNRFGEVSTKRESPATQAKTAFYSLRDNYLNGAHGAALSGIPMGWAVLFPDIVRPAGSSALPDQPDEVTGYAETCQDAAALVRFLRGVIRHWAHFERARRPFDPQSMAAILAHLRPDFEQVPPLASRLRDFGDDLAALTREQYSRLDDIQENERILVRGGAGTGKTFLAVASARYAAAAGRDVLLTTRSAFLVDYIAATDLPANLDVLAFADILPKLAQRGRPWDALIVDEAQDLCQASSVDILDAAVAGGMEQGRWQWFGDPNRQVSASHELDPDVLAYLESLSVRCRLSQNVRNAPTVVDAIRRYAGADAGSPSARGVGASVEFRRCRGSYIEEVIAVVQDWLSGEGAAKRSEVAVLVPGLELVDPMVAALSAGRIRAEPLAARRGGHKLRDVVVVATVDDFKGLERPLICVAGLGEPAELMVRRGHLYRAFSRANHTLAIVCTVAEGREMERIASSIQGEELEIGRA